MHEGIRLICKLTGYHGTTKENAEIIIENNKFLKSNSEEDWLDQEYIFTIILKMHMNIT